MNCRVCAYSKIHRDINGYGSIRVTAECRLKTDKLETLDICPLEMIDEIRDKAVQIGLATPKQHKFEMIVDDEDDILEILERVKKSIGSYGKICDICKINRNTLWRARKSKKINLSKKIIDLLDYAGYVLYIKEI